MELEAVPEVSAVGATNQLPGEPDDLIVTPLFQLPGADPTQRAWRLVATQGYFGAAGIPRIAGRSFAMSDTADSPRVVIVNERVCTMVGLSPRAIVGRRVKFDGQSAEVIGVVGNVRLRGPEDDGWAPICYMPNSQGGAAPRLHFVVKTRINPAALASSVRAACARVDPAIPPYQMRTLAAVRASRLADRRFAMTGTITFGGLALGLSILGLYGVLAHLVQQRTKEIGVRMALGASAARLRWSVLTSGARHTVAGVGVGVAGGLGLWKLVTAQVPGLGHMDAEIVAVVSGILLVVALTATWIPARRATRINPLDALRSE